MKRNGCPYSARCFLKMSLNCLKLPQLEEYCARGYEGCRHYGNLKQLARESEGAVA